MIKKKLFLTVAVVLSLSATAWAAPDDSLKDVPKGHWAYGAIQQLAADGIITGYKDGTFKGDQPMTRYEMACVVEKALNNAGKATSVDKDLLESLCVEFRSDLDSQEKRIKKLEAHNLTTHADMAVRYVYDEYNKKMRRNENNNLYLNILNDYQLNETWVAHMQSEVKYYWGNRLGYNYANDPWGGNTSDPAGGGEYGNNRSGTTDKNLFERLWLTGKVGLVDVTVGRKWDEFGTGLVWGNEATGLWLGLGNNHTTLFVAQGNDTNTNKMDNTVQGDRHFDAYGMYTYRQVNDKVKLGLLLGGNQSTYGIEGQGGKRQLASTKWGEINANVNLNKNLQLSGGITMTNADDYNSSYIVGVKYKDIDLEKPGTFAAYIKNARIARNGAAGGDVYGGSKEGGWAGLGLNAGGTWQNDWGVFDIGTDMWRQTSALKAWVYGIDYVLDKNLDWEIVYSPQTLDRPLEQTKYKRNYLRTAVKFHF
jgi:hypothetical protein